MKYGINVLLHYEFARHLDHIEGLECAAMLNRASMADIITRYVERTPEIEQGFVDLVTRCATTNNQNELDIMVRAILRVLQDMQNHYYPNMTEIHEYKVEKEFQEIMEKYDLVEVTDKKERERIIKSFGLGKDSDEKFR